MLATATMRPFALSGQCSTKETSRVHVTGGHKHLLPRLEAFEVLQIQRTLEYIPKAGHSSLPPALQLDTWNFCQYLVRQTTERAAAHLLQLHDSHLFLHGCRRHSLRPHLNERDHLSFNPYEQKQTGLERAKRGFARPSL